MPGVRFASRDDDEQDDYGIDVLAVRSLRRDLERGPAAADVSLFMMNATNLAG
jgi:hypothetical protein